MVNMICVIVLFAVSWCLLIVRTMWLYGSPILWWAYQIEHLVLFVLAVLYFRSSAGRVVLASLVLAILIGTIPYGLWFSFVSEGELSSGFFSDITESLPVYIRLLAEVSFYPFAQLGLMLTTSYVVRASQTRR